MARVIAGLAVTLLLLLGAAVYLGLSWWRTPLVPAGEPAVIVLAPGETLGDLTERLAARNLLSSPWLLKLLARVQGADSRLQSGEYALPPGTTPADLLALLQRGETVRYAVTLPEGITLASALDILRRAPALTTVLKGPDDAALLELVAPAPGAEGYFLPETYQYQRGDTDLSVLRQAHGLMRDKLARLWTQRDPSLPLATPYDALILASIIERETGVPRERPEIAGVFIRRLARGMRLQTDPTVIYGLGPSFDGNLTRVHLRDETNPYNTYRHHGLPPGPIALPGLAALEAALDPAPGNALYFVARGDGSHVFSDTLAAHERAVAEYQLKRRADYRSSPGGANHE